MTTEAAYRTADRAKSAGRWLVWRPMRLFLIVAVVLLVWFAVAQLTREEEPPTPSPVATTGAGELPPQWQTWPSTDATTVPPG